MSKTSEKSTIQFLTESKFQYIVLTTRIWDGNQDITPNFPKNLEKVNEE